MLKEEYFLLKSVWTVGHCRLLVVSVLTAACHFCYLLVISQRQRQFNSTKEITVCQEHVGKKNVAI